VGSCSELRSATTRGRTEAFFLLLCVQNPQKAVDGIISYMLLDIQLERRIIFRSRFADGRK